MAQAILGFMQPFSKCSTVSSLGDTPDHMTTVDSDYTWSVVDWSNSPGYVWTDDDTPHLYLEFADTLTNFDWKTKYIYINSSGGFDSDGLYVDPEANEYGYFNLDDNIYAGHKTTEGKVAEGAFVGNAWQQPADHIAGIVLHRPDGLGLDEIDVKEVAIFNTMTLPWNPESATYSVSPILPAAGFQTYTTMSGRKQQLVYADIQYQINLSFTWSDKAYTDRLADGLAATLRQGTPILFIEPEEANPRAFIFTIDSVQPIMNPTPGVWTWSVAGVTQP